MKDESYANNKMKNKQSHSHAFYTLFTHNFENIKQHLDSCHHSALNPPPH